MSLIRPGKYLTYLNLGRNTFKDSIKFAFSKDLNQLRISRLRTNTKLFGYFNKLEDNNLTLTYIDPNNKQVGGTVRVDTKEVNFSKLSTMSYAQHGYFNEDKIVFATFDKEGDINTGIMFDEIISPSINNTNIIVRHNYEIVGNELHYRLEANPNLVSKLNDEISKTEVSSELLYKPNSSFTEKFFYNLSYSN